MTRLLVYTGKGGAGVSTCAAATAQRLARNGTPTALVSIDRKGTLSDAFGVDVGPEPTAVRPDLTAVEINPQAGQDTYQEIVERIAGVASVGGIDFTDGHVATFIESNHVPFGREVAALEAVASFVGDSDYEAVVFDTGLHGRIVRLLRMPGMVGMGVDIASDGIEIAADGVDATTDRLATATGQVLDPLLSPLGAAGAAAGGPADGANVGGDEERPGGASAAGDGDAGNGAVEAGDRVPADGAPDTGDADAGEAAAERELLESKVATVRSIIGGAGSRELRVVTTPDRVAARWTDHLVTNVRNAGIPAGPLVVNKVVQNGSCCDRCAAIRAEQQATLQDLREREDLGVVELPDLHGDLAGEEMLARLADDLVAGGTAGGAGATP